MSVQLRIRQRVFSWTDSYDVFDEYGNAKYFVRAQMFSIGHQIHVYEKATGREVGSIHQRLLTFLPKFDIVINGQNVGSVSRQLSLFVPRYEVDFQGWEASGDFLGWNYRVTDGCADVMSISKELLSWGDTYVLNYSNPNFEIPGLLLVIAIDAANCDE